VRTTFNFEGFGERQSIVSKAELHIALALLVEQADAFEVINLRDGNYLIQKRSHTDRDECIIAEYNRSKDTTK
jgi:hypothetical protein